jgi:FkbM family methyltransferase
MNAFRVQRPEDVNLEIAIAPEGGVRMFTCFANAALNGFHSDEAVARHLSRGDPVIKQVEVKCVPINDILAEYVGGRQIDLLTVDVEGLDCEILGSLDLRRWRPTMIITEILAAGSMDDVMRSDVCRLLHDRGYMLFSRLHFSAIFIEGDAYIAASLRH